jgi:hypothetical protein
VLFITPLLWLSRFGLRDSRRVNRGKKIHVGHVNEERKTGDTLSLRHVGSCDVNTCSWDVRGDLTLNCIVQI